MRKRNGLTALLLFTYLAAATAESIPNWVLNHRAAIPESEYIAQLGTGGSADAARADATEAVARYFQTSVSASLSADGAVAVDEVKVSSEVSLFALEYTEPYYYKKAKKWYCLAFIRRPDAWARYKPRIEFAKDVFLRLYECAEAETDPFMRLSRLKTAQGAVSDMLEKLEYGRTISPQNEAAYLSVRDKAARIPVLFEAAKKECTVFVSAHGDYNRAMEQAVSTALVKNGFTVARNADGAKYTASVDVDDNASGSDPVAIMPTVSLKIMGNGGNAVYSYEAAASEKTMAYTLENAKKRAYPKLAQEMESALQKDLGAISKL
ncbi:MAG: hypothetical protein K2N58_01975 [Treponemataceae bacterium]|nr:hypothetical protein [Treponemataceae bacterium]